jgi:predicted pyridoxine 5'-phosphate oxidase superfamily flavin-nucleotide-binding protein
VYVTLQTLTSAPDRSTAHRAVDGAAEDLECDPLPGSAGERALQCAYGTEVRAQRFYAEQVRDRLLPAMIAFVERTEMVFVASSDTHGECDASLRAGPPGFLRVLDERTLAYPEYRGNGVHASLGNISENGHVGLLMVDFVEDLIGLHVNGRARIVEDAEFRAAHPGVQPDAERGRRAERWVVIEVEEAYIHCRKHIPRMRRVHEKREWGTDDPGRKGGDYFGARGTPARMPVRRRRFPSTTHLAGGAARVLRSAGATRGGDTRGR